MKKEITKWIAIVCIILGVLSYTGPFLEVSAMGMKISLTGLIFTLGGQSETLGELPAILSIGVILAFIAVVLEFVIKKGKWIFIFPLLTIIYNSVVLNMITEMVKEELGYLSALVQVQYGYGFFLSSSFFIVAILSIMFTKFEANQKSTGFSEQSVAQNDAENVNVNTEMEANPDKHTPPAGDETGSQESKTNISTLMKEALPKAQEIGQKTEKWVKDNLNEENKNKFKEKMTVLMHAVSKHKKQIALVVCIAFLMGGALFTYRFISSIPKTIEVNLKDYYTVEFSNLNGEGIATGSWKDGYYTAFAGQDEKLDYDLERRRENLASSINVQIEPNVRLKNGDVVKVTMLYDEEQAKESKVKLKDNQFEVTVSGLKDAQVLDVFEGLKVNFSGISPFIEVTLDATGCSSFVQSNVEFELPNNYLKNGDSFTVTAKYDPSIMEENLYKVNINQKNFTVENCGEYLTSLEGKDLGAINQELIDKREAIDAQETRTDPDWSYNNRVVDINVSDIVDRDHGFLTDKSQPILTKQFLLTRKQNKIEEGRTMNRYCQVFEYTITARDYNNETTNQGKVYLVVWADNLYSEDGKMINWNPELGWSANTNLQQLIADTVTTYRDNYNVTEIPVK